MIGAAIVFGIIEGGTNVESNTWSPLGLAELFAMNAIMYYWFINDAETINYSPTPFLRFSVLAFGIFAIAYYLFRTRRFPKCLKSYLYSLLLLFVASLVWALSSTIVEVAGKYMI
jgi:hypothetical protein